MTSIVGTPLLGSMAIRDIRRSGGKLYGLRLALADLLLYPIVLVDLLILAVVGGTVALVLSVLVGGSLGGMEMILILVILGLPILAIVDFLIIRWAWRKVRTPLIEESNSLE
ncbi:MAG: hypothetical protein O3C21_03095 [Verrucomicrobia bacterium]|nr:hypothetical protein [Verrucomicrobiota bacterium]